MLNEVLPEIPRRRRLEIFDGLGQYLERLPLNPLAAVARREYDYSVRLTNLDFEPVTVAFHSERVFRKTKLQCGARLSQSQ